MKEVLYLGILHMYIGTFGGFYYELGGESNDQNLQDIYKYETRKRDIYSKEKNMTARDNNNKSRDNVGLSRKT